MFASAEAPSAADLELFRAVEALLAEGRVGPDAVAETVPPLAPELAPASPHRLSACVEAAAQLREGLCGERAKLYALPKLKRQLIDRFGLDVTAGLLAAATGHAGVQCPARVELVSMLYHARARSGDFREVSAPEDGRGARSGATGPAASTGGRIAFAATLKNAVISGKSNHVLFSEIAVADFQGDELSLWPLNHDVDPILLEQAAEDAGAAPRLHALMPVAGERPARVPRALSLTGIHSYAFGHWMLEFLPKLWCLMDEPGFAGTSLVVDRQMPAQHMEALRLFVGPEHPILTVEPAEQVAVDELYVVGLPFYAPAGVKPGADVPPPSLDASVFLRWIARAKTRVEGTLAAGGGRRLYLSRKPYQRRKLVNPEAVTETLERRGFVTVDPAELSFREQLELIHSADIVVVADGSASLLMMFARPDTRVGLLSHGLSNYDAGDDLADGLGLRYVTLAGEIERRDASYKANTDYRIPIDGLNDLVDELERP